MRHRNPHFGGNLLALVQLGLPACPGGGGKEDSSHANHVPEKPARREK